MKKRMLLPLIMGAVAMLFVLAGCGGSDTSAEKDADTLVLGAQSDFVLGTAYEGPSLVFEKLLNLDADMSIIPGIIESWDTNDEHSEYTLHVREGVNFSDGTPVTAEIIQADMEEWGPFKDGEYIYEEPEYTVVDDQTLKVTFSGSYGTLPIELTGIFCSQPGALDDNGNVTNFIGTGPFVLDDYEKDQSATLSVNEDYWNKDKMPSVKKVEWKVIPDENARVLAVESGEVDAIGVTEHYCTIPYSSIADIEDKGELNVDVKHSCGLTETYVYNYLKGPMEDINLRKAVTFAIDREGLAKELTNGYGDPSGYFMNPDYKFNARNEKPYEYDPEEAAKCLKEAGYEDADGDGIVEKDGTPLKLTLLVDSTESARSAAVYVQDNLKAIGIDSDIQALDDAARGERAEAGDFDIAYTHPWLNTPQSYMTWRCTGSDYDDFGTCFGINDKFPGYIETMTTAKSDDELWDLFDQVWADEYAFYPGTALFTTPRAFISAKGITGFTFCPDETMMDLSEVTIER